MSFDPLVVQTPTLCGSFKFPPFAGMSLIMYADLVRCMSSIQRIPFIEMFINILNFLVFHTVLFNNRLF